MIIESQSKQQKGHKIDRRHLFFGRELQLRLLFHLPPIIITVSCKCKAENNPTSFPGKKKKDPGNDVEYNPAQGEVDSDISGLFTKHKLCLSKTTMYNLMM